MFLRQLRGVLIRIDHVLNFGWASIPIHVIGNKANAIPPPTVIGVRCSHAAPLHDFGAGVAHVGDNFIHHGVGFRFGLAGDTADANGQFVSDAFAVLVFQEAEVIIAHVTPCWTDGIFALVREHIGRSLEVDAVGVGAVTEQLQIPRGRPTSIQGAVPQHHHQHLDGRGVNAATRKFIENRSLRRHQHIQAVIGVQGSQPVRSLQEQRPRHDDQVSAFDGMQIGRRDESSESRFGEGRLRKSDIGPRRI